MTAMRREPWSKFYWADWRSNKELRDCTLTARGLWMEMLCLMHEAMPYGHLLIKGKPPTPEKLALQVGAPVNVVRKALKELEEAAVGDIRDGVWVSRRMVRDAHRRAVNQENGKEGGNPKLLNNQNLAKSDNRNQEVRITIPDKSTDKSHDARDPEARSQKPEDAASAASARTPEKALAEKANATRLALCDVFGTDENRQPAWARIDAIAGWLAAGADVDLDILPAARAVLARRGAKGPPGSTSYLTDAVMDAMRTRLAGLTSMPIGPAVVTNPAREAAAKLHNAAMDAWIAGGREGPKPMLADFLAAAPVDDPDGFATAPFLQRTKATA